MNDSSGPKSTDPKTPLDAGMTEKEKGRMIDQMEEFEGPEKREIRGEEREPAKDPGVAHS